MTYYQSGKEVADADAEKTLPPESVIDGSGEMHNDFMKLRRQAADNFVALYPLINGLYLLTTKDETQSASQLEFAGPMASLNYVPEEAREALKRALNKSGALYDIINGGCGKNAYYGLSVNDLADPGIMAKFADALKEELGKLSDHNGPAETAGRTLTKDWARAQRVIEGR